MKAIVIGGGIGGLTTAIALEKSGIDVEVYERASRLTAVGAGLTLWANAINVFKALDMSDALLKLGCFEGRGVIRTAKGDILTAARINGKQGTSAIESIIVHRADLHELLLNQFHGNVHLGSEFKRCTQSASGITAHFADGTSVECDVLIAADGIHSAVRQQIITQAKPIYAGYTAYRAVVPFDHARVGDVWGESWGHGSRFGLAPLSDNRVYWFATQNTPDGQRHTSNEDTKAHLQEIFADWHHPIKQVIEETRASDILHHDIYEISPLDTWIHGRVVLLGDAAHAMTPNLGQGACQAIEDAYTLAYCLAATTDIDSALQTYQTLRMPRANAILRQSHQIGVVGQLENMLLCGVRNQVFRYLPDGIRDRSLNAVVNYSLEKVLEGALPALQSNGSASEK
ncbi:MAG: FAD-dependent monooxygenase [Anaerolineae bacterium]|nr:FAD-dependent monooxygenase [Anaerolineae bacterium]